MNTHKNKFDSFAGFSLLGGVVIVVVFFIVLIGGYFVVEKIYTPTSPSISRTEIDQHGTSSPTGIRYINNNPISNGNSVVAVISTSTGGTTNAPGIDKQSFDASTTGALTVAVLKNTKYGDLVFVNGKNDDSFHCSVDGVTYGDLNNDKKPDAVVQIGCVGAGYVASLYPVINVNDRPIVLPNIMYGHNNNPHGDIAGISIKNGVVSIVSDARFQNDKHTEFFALSTIPSTTSSLWMVEVGDSSFSPSSWTWKKYASQNISFLYPSFLKFSNIGQYTFDFPTKFLPHTNLGSTHITVSKQSDIKKDDCLRVIPHDNNRVENNTINGIPFTIFSYDEGAAGSTYHTRMYASYSSTGSCYQISLVGQSMNDVNGYNIDHPDDLLAFYNPAILDGILDQVMATFVIF